MTNLLTNSEIKSIVKEKNSLENKMFKVSEKYQNLAYKYGCLNCTVRGKISNIPFSKLYDNCNSCPKYAKIKDTYSESVKYDEEHRKIIYKLAKIVFELLDGSDVKVIFLKKHIKTFNEFFGNKFSTVPENQIEYIALLADGTGPYK